MKFYVVLFKLILILVILLYVGRRRGLILKYIEFFGSVFRFKVRFCLLKDKENEVFFYIIECVDINVFLIY